MERIKEFFNKIWKWIKDHWIIVTTFIVGLFTFIFRRNRSGDRIFRESKDRIEQSGQQFAEHSNTIQKSRDENTKLGCDIESSIRQTEGIREDNKSISDTIDDTRDQLSNIESSIQQRIDELRESKER